MDNCIFCKIVNGEMNAEKIYEDEECLVIPDKFPAYEGQCLVIIKKHMPYFLDLENNLFNHCMNIARKVSRALDKTFDNERTCLVIEGFHVPHFHIKLYPVKDKTLILTGSKSSEDSALKIVVEKIRGNLNVQS